MNGKLQLSTTIVMAIFSIGVIWHRISANAAAVKETINQIRDEQRAMSDKLDTLIHKP